MAKCKTFYSDDNRTNYEMHDLEIKSFLEELETNGHTFININTISFGRNNGYVDRFRTEITYMENPTRTVIVEKV